MRIDEDRVTLLGVNEPPFHLPFALLSAVSFSIDGINPLLLGYRRNPRVHLHAWLVACCKTRPHHSAFRTVRHAFSRARSTRDTRTCRSVETLILNVHWTMTVPRVIDGI